MLMDAIEAGFCSVTVMRCWKGRNGIVASAYFSAVLNFVIRLERGESDAEFWQVIPRLFHGIFKHVR